MSIRYDILIPAYNAQNTLPPILSQIKNLAEPPANVLVVDDGSTDRTPEVVEQNAFVTLLRLEQNQGKGSALRHGIDHFLKNSRSPFLLLMDADGQHPVDSIPQFLESSRSNSADIWIGFRSEKVGRMPALRIFSNTVSSLITSWVTGQRIYDSQCGFRLLKRTVLEQIVLTESGFQIETELIVKAARQGFTIQFVPIPTIYNGEKSYIKHVNDTIRFLSIIARELLQK